MLDTSKYNESKEIWYKWRREAAKKLGHDPICSYVVFEYDHNGSYLLEMYHVDNIGPVIFQFWPHKRGFHVYANCKTSDLIKRIG